jgi:hypothetical protein
MAKKQKRDEEINYNNIPSGEPSQTPSEFDCGILIACDKGDDDAQLFE